MARLLISDDDDLVVSAVTRIGTGLGLEVIPDKRGEAVELAIEHKPDVIILDIHQGLVDGRDLLARLKAHPETEHIEVIVISGAANHSSATECMVLGAAAFVAKPFGMEFMLEVARLARGKQARPPEAAKPSGEDLPRWASFGASPQPTPPLRPVSLGEESD